MRKSFFLFCFLIYNYSSVASIHGGQRLQYLYDASIVSPSDDYHNMIADWCRKKG